MLRSVKAALAAGVLASLAVPAWADEPVLGLAAIDLQNSFFVRMKEAGDVAAKDYGVKTTWQSAEGSLEKQVGIIENFINQKVGAILVDPLDKNAVIPVLKKAAEAGIPVITMGNKVEAGTNYSTLYPDAENMAMVARGLGASLGGEGEVALLVGSRGNFVAHPRASVRRHAEEGISQHQDRRHRADQLGRGEGHQRDPDLVRQLIRTSRVSPAFPTNSSAWCGFRSPAQWAATCSMPAMTGDDEMGDLLESGKMVIDVLTGAYRVGYWNIAVAARLGKGEKLPYDLYMPTYFITSDATAKKLKEANVSFDYITPEKAKVEAKNYTAQLGPKVDTGAMTVGKK